MSPDSPVKFSWLRFMVTIPATYILAWLVILSVEGSFLFGALGYNSFLQANYVYIAPLAVSALSAVWELFLAEEYTPRTYRRVGVYTLAVLLINVAFYQFVAGELTLFLLALFGIPFD